MARRWAGALVAAAALTVAAVSVAAAHDAAGSRGAVISVGEGGPPNYMFPLEPTQFGTVYNVNFLSLMYRPLIWTGRGTRAVIDWGLSLALSPRYEDGGRVVVVTLKPYRWSDGERVTGRDVAFFMNLYKVEKQKIVSYAPGTLPDNVRSVSARGSTVTFVLAHRVSSEWFTGNELGQITPFPRAWDITRAGATPGSAGCATASWSSIVVRKTKEGVTPVSAAARSCAAVFDFLSRESGWDPADPNASKGADSTFATNPLWQVVDGPWHLTSYNSDGFAALKPNPSYSGPIKPTIAELDYLPFTTTAAEFNALADGTLSEGFVPFADITAEAKSPTEAGANNPKLARAFDAPLLYLSGSNAIIFNFNSVGDGGEAGHLFRQLYFRQAMQLLVDQQLYVQKLYRGYGVTEAGPVPVLPANPYTSAYERRNPYPYDPARAVGLLRAHGWHVLPHRTSVCADRARCGVPAGTKLDLSMPYVTGDQVADEQIAAMASSWEQAGIHVRPRPVGSIPLFLGEVLPCKGTRCTWELAASSWTYGAYPSGESLFETGAASNLGSYSDATADRLIRQSIDTNVGLTRYENYLAKELPVLWQPYTPTILEVKRNIRGFALSPFVTWTPEAWRVR